MGAAPGGLGDACPPASTGAGAEGPQLTPAHPERGAETTEAALGNVLYSVPGPAASRSGPVPHSKKNMPGVR